METNNCSNFSSVRPPRPGDLVEPARSFLVVTKGEKVGIFTNLNQFDMGRLLMVPGFALRECLDWESAVAHYTQHFEAGEVTLASAVTMPPIAPTPSTPISAASSLSDIPSLAAAPSWTTRPTPIPKRRAAEASALSSPEQSISTPESKPFGLAKPRPEVSDDNYVEIVSITTGTGTEGNPYTIDWDVGRGAKKRRFKDLGHGKSSARTWIRRRSPQRAEDSSSKASVDGMGTVDSGEMGELSTDRVIVHGSNPAIASSSTNIGTGWGISNAVVRYVPFNPFPAFPVASTSTSIPALGGMLAIHSQHHKSEGQIMVGDPEMGAEYERTRQYLENLQEDSRARDTSIDRKSL